MSLKFLKVNPETANITAGIAFICAVLAVSLGCWYLVLFKLLPYLIHHLSFSYAARVNPLVTFSTIVDKLRQ